MLILSSSLLIFFSNAQRYPNIPTQQIRTMAKTIYNEFCEKNSIRLPLWFVDDNRDERI
jgi:hypothetical protein